jgi:hypothetical protein
MTKFKTNCTLPESVVTYVSQPNTRGTLDILWSCLGIVVLCTWSVQHPNVPELRTEDSKRSKIGDIIKQVRLMVFTLLAPEFLLLKAVAELNSAGSISKKLGVRANSDGVPWSMVHSFFSNMGGFVIHFKDYTPIPASIPYWSQYLKRKLLFDLLFHPLRRRMKYGTSKLLPQPAQPQLPLTARKQYLQERRKFLLYLPR